MYICIFYILYLVFLNFQFATIPYMPYILLTLFVCLYLYLYDSMMNTCSYKSIYNNNNNKCSLSFILYSGPIFCFNF